MSSIEWTDGTWNPVRGCSRVSEGCRNCYAERMAARFSRPEPFQIAPFEGFAKMTPAGPRWTGRVELIPEKLDEPLRWRRPRRVFVNSMSDLFHEALPLRDLDRAFAVMALAQNHTFQILTKRPAWMLRYMTGGRERQEWVFREMVALDSEKAHHHFTGDWPLPNVWLGVSCEDQATADERISLLLQTPAAVRFVSLEPLLGPIDLRPGSYLPPGPPFCDAGPFLDWVIVGGESGPGARPCDVAWIRSIRDQCKAAGVPAFVKQLGARPLGLPHGDSLPGTNAPWGSLSNAKGGDPDQWPEDLRVREFPR